MRAARTHEIEPNELNRRRNGEYDPADVFGARDVEELTNEQRPVDGYAAFEREGAYEPGRAEMKRSGEELDELAVEIVQAAHS